MTKPQKYTISRGPFKNRDARQLSSKDMLTIIKTIRRTADADAGAHMMEFILEKKGVTGVIEFVEWGQKVLDNTGMILKSDFMPTDGENLTAEESKMLRAARPGMTRRNFLFNVAPWYLIAAAGAVHSGAGMLENFTRKNPTAVGSPPEQGNIPGYIRQTLDEAGYPLEFIGSASLAWLASKDSNDDKFRQISNAVAEMGQILGISERIASYRLNPPNQQCKR